MPEYRFKYNDHVTIRQIPGVVNGKTGTVIGVAHSLPVVGLIYIVLVQEKIPDYDYGAILVPESCLEHFDEWGM